MNRRSLVLIFAVSAFAVPVLADAPVAPYAGQQTRTIKALCTRGCSCVAQGRRNGTGEGG